MNTVNIYGIQNCDTMKKALAWLDKNKIEHIFHNYKKDGADPDIIQNALDQLGWEIVINKNGTTWRKLPDDLKASMNDENALALAIENPSVVKRPLLVLHGAVHVGFKETQYRKLFDL